MVAGLCPSTVCTLSFLTAHHLYTLSSCGHGCLMRAVVLLACDLPVRPWQHSSADDYLHHLDAGMQEYCSCTASLSHTRVYDSLLGAGCNMS